MHSLGLVFTFATAILAAPQVQQAQSSVNVGGMPGGGDNVCNGSLYSSVGLASFDE